MDPEARRVVIGPRDLVCPPCGHDRFHERQAQLNTPAATFFGFDWANKTATCFVCERCSHILWFLHPPTPAPEAGP